MIYINTGWLEVGLDRRMNQDDWRGLGEGVTDNESTTSSFMLVFEQTSSNTVSCNCYNCMFRERERFLVSIYLTPMCNVFAKRDGSVYQCNELVSAFNNVTADMIKPVGERR